MACCKFRVFDFPRLDFSRVGNFVCAFFSIDFRGWTSSSLFGSFRGFVMRGRFSEPFFLGGAWWRPEWRDVDLRRAGLEIAISGYFFWRVSSFVFSSVGFLSGLGFGGILLPLSCDRTTSYRQIFFSLCADFRVSTPHDVLLAVGFLFGLRFP